ncbi:MAG TPA: DUF6079 family protein [Pyrinomonadaceae bacterium]|jgi:hypothetical protein
MKRTQDKIKDYVEPQAFDEVPNIAADPARALAAYRFTDATSDLLARWLDALADLPRGRGTARALAGARGVGKSHALAVFGALAGAPELRGAVDDAHVVTSARRLMNRRYVVVRVERGTRPTLVEEMALAFADAFGGGNDTQWGDDPVMMLTIGASFLHDATLVVMIDTAFGREARVGRDDGPVLSQLAAGAQSINAFVALALDDDIADASGVNSVLAGSYQIDYLDPEHLYRVVDRYLLRKNPQARVALHDIYLSLRSSVPGFNWSEPRFAALYPVHPLVADVAAAVRLYAPRFAFLPFAAAAAARAVGRPALSLILLDEVFDRAEDDLRHSKDLHDAFTVYDELATKSVAQFPVMQRLEAKLVLKSLFILSLDGRGATASELCAALLFPDERATGAAVKRIDETLARFAEAARGSALKATEEGGESRYSFQISAVSNFADALDASVETLPQQGGAAVNELMRAIARARFEDWPLAVENVETAVAVASTAAPLTNATANFQLRWRGTERPGRFIWQPNAGAAPLPQPAAFQIDWQIMMLAPVEELDENAAGGSDFVRSDVVESVAGVSDGVSVDGAPRVSFSWKPATLLPEELMTLRRLIALRTDAQLGADFGETAHAAASTLGAQAERIWTRIYMDDGALVAADGSRRTFTDRARAARTLAVALEETFAPLFRELYTQHPVFAETLTETEVARLMDGFFGGAGATEAGMQYLASTFALPLGLAAMRGETLTFETGDEALGRPWVREVLALADKAIDGGIVPLKTVQRALQRPPYGLLREAQHLILAALVAQRRIELVTTTGDRISRRTLDRSIRWDDLAGVCRAAAIHHSAEELAAWARLLTGNHALASIAEPEAREAVRAALSEWLEAWRAGRVFESVNALPDGGLTTRVWNLSTAIRKSFGTAGDAIAALLAGDVSLEESLQRVADAFGDVPENFAHSSKQLAELKEYTANFAARESARAYLALAEPTGAGEIESARRELLAIAEDTHSLFNHESRERFNLLWREFHARYAEHYASAHDRAVGNSNDRRALDAITRGAAWREFEALSQLSIVNHEHWHTATELLRRAARTRCNFPVRQLLEEHPSCVCSFRLARALDSARLPRDLDEVVNHGLAAYRRTLTLFSTQFHHALAALAAREGKDDEAASNRALLLGETFAQGRLPTHFSGADVRLLERAIETMEVPPPVRVHPPTENCGLLTREELSARLRQWLDDLPNHSALVEIISESETDAA